MREKTAYKILVGKPEGKRPLGKPRRRWEDNIKKDLRDIGWGGTDWIDRAQNRDQWRALVNVVINFGFHKMCSSWVPAQLAASQMGISSMQLVSYVYGLPTTRPHAHYHVLHWNTYITQKEMWPPTRDILHNQQSLYSCAYRRRNLFNYSWYRLINYSFKR
jgi:hypothetical protein